MNILCMTPIEHLDGALNLINQFGEVTYLPNILKNEVNAKLIENKITHIFTNPNKQNFILNAELLSNTSVQVINTCSTGLNHIDKQYCTDNNIDIEVTHRNLNDNSIEGIRFKNKSIFSVLSSCCSLAEIPA